MIQKYGIAITLYDKFDELAILHDIVRYNFKYPFYLYVCSNHPDAEEEITKRNLRLDGFTSGENIEFQRKNEKETFFTWSQVNLNSPIEFPVLTSRTVDSVQRSCKLAIEDGCDYVMHVHSDAWPLSEKELLKLFSQMEQEDYWLMLRGDIDYITAVRPFGFFDDHFFFFNVEKIVEYRVFEFDVLDLLPHRFSVHEIFPILFLTRLPRRRVFQY